MNETFHVCIAECHETIRCVLEVKIRDMLNVAGIFFTVFYGILLRGKCKGKICKFS